LRPLCGEPGDAPSYDRYELTSVVADPLRGRVLFARHGGGLSTVTCDRSPQRDLEHAALRLATALRLDPRSLEVLVATDDAVSRLGPSAPRRLYATAPSGLPPDALPMQLHADGARVLVTSESTGAFELSAAGERWSLARSWRAGRELPDAVFGPAAYGKDGHPAVVLKSKGVALTSARGTTVLDRASGLATAHALIVAPGATEELWVAFGKTPFEDTPHALQLIRDGKVAAAIDLPVADAQAIGDILPQPGSDKAFVATRFGVFEVDASGRFERRSQHAVTRLFRNAQTGLVAAVGSTVEQLVDGRFEPLLFQARAADGSPPAGHPVDVVVDERGRFLLLYSGGQVRDLLTG
jgi:hypothetical protein